MLLLRKVSRTLAAIAISASLLIGFPLSPALAVIPTFDAANYAKDIEMLAKTTLITEQQAKHLQLVLAQYNEQIVQGRINISELWPTIAPDLQRLFAMTKTGPALSISATDVLEQFKRAYPTFSEDQPYAQQYVLYKRNAENGIIGALRVAQSLDSDLAAKRVSLDDLVKTQKPQGQMDALRIGNMIANQQVQEISGMRGTIGAMLTAESNYYSAMLATEDKKRKDPGRYALMSMFAQAPKELVK